MFRSRARTGSTEPTDPGATATTPDRQGDPVDGRVSELERALRAGEREAAEELVRLTYRRIHAVLLRWTRDPALAEDLTQETYRRAWSSLDGFRGDARFASWLHRIAYTTFLNSLRGADRGRLLEPEEIGSLSDEGPGPAQLTEERDRDQRLRAATDALPEPFRRTVLAFYWAELTVADLAGAEGVTTVAIRKRLEKARRLIRARLDPAPLQPTDAESLR